MNTDDPIANQSYEIAEVYAFAPTEFELAPSRLVWEPPCWIHADIILIPKSTATREKFLFNLKISNYWDAFAKTLWKDQLWEVFRPHFFSTKGPYSEAWKSELWRCFQILKQNLSKTADLFLEPFRFVGRNEYKTVKLAEILKEHPETLSVYIALEKRPYCNYIFLRIHSNLPFIEQNPKYLWFEKRLPERMHLEDILPWFLATINRLPKRDRPAELEVWTKRLLYFGPHLKFPKDDPNKPWLDKPKVVFVLGPTGKVGYRRLIHFERRDISRIARQNDVVQIKGKERVNWNDGSTIEYEETIFLFTFDDAAAERVEHQILAGRRIHFGLDADVFGMACRYENAIYAINVSEEKLRKLGQKPNFDLVAVSNPRDKLKVYTFRKQS